MSTDDYKKENCSVGFLSDLAPEEGEALIGKTIKSVDANEYSLLLEFTDGTKLEVTGGRWDGCAMGVEYSV